MGVIGGRARLRNVLTRFAKEYAFELPGGRTEPIRAPSHGVRATPAWRAFRPINLSQ
jgi:hypothetical protein